eukprot:CAMPEP_0194300228 /NCGR_PEP_ID=MMETSP0169-20130528/61137_1 /TAXON_ID=218684 /ORGANISM="Corethron pennatum, Strain L29A3" /LENGTH=720 /DNA_ID=CAMNT_0039050377 /DNA_START=314 /DNA_END=2477 /DNA_ORIENTATION=+
MNASDIVITTLPSVSSISLTGRVATEDDVLDEESAGSGPVTNTRRSKQENEDVKPLYYAGVFSCIIVVTLIGAVLAILLNNKPPVKDAATKNSFLLTFIGEDPEKLLTRCEGDCDTDADCSLGFVCFLGEEGGSVPGCGGGPTSITVDYCIRPEDIPTAELFAEPQHSPSVGPSFSPYFSPSIGSTPAPTATLAFAPSTAPSAEPSAEPQDNPSVRPSFSQSFSSSIGPTSASTAKPTSKIKAALELSFDLVKDAYGDKIPSWTTAETNDKESMSAHFRAVKWCVRNKVFDMEGDFPLIYFSLASFFYGAGGVEKKSESGRLHEATSDNPGWSDSEGWLNLEEFPSYCNWKGITCRDITDVGTIPGIDIDVSYMDIKGTLVPEIFMIPKLIKFSIWKNEFTGPIPSAIGLAKDLEVLLVSNNNFEGSIPRTISNLKQIKMLHIGHNQFTGSIPEEIGECQLLSELMAMGNTFTGTIPEAFYNLSNIETLSLAATVLKGQFRELMAMGNTFTGTIPEAFYNLSNMETLSLSRTRIEGTISKSIGKFSSLKSFRAVKTNLSGTIPSTVGNLTELRELQLHMNAFTGIIPEELGDIDPLRKLYLWGNKLNGPIPDSIYSHPAIIELHLSKNELTGTIPEIIGLMSNVALIQFENNKLSGKIPEALGRLDNLSTLNLHSNNLTGSVPALICGMVQLTHFQTDCTRLVECSCCTLCCDQGLCNSV